MEKKSEEFAVIRLTDIFYYLRKHRLMIVALAVCGLAVGIVLSILSYMRGEMSRTYAITSAIVVTSQTQDGLYTSKERTPNSTDISLAENMTDSVIFVMKSDKTLDEAIKRLDLVGISIKDIYDNLNVTKYGSTQIIEMKLFWRNAEEGIAILNAINAVAPSVLAEVLQIGNVSVVNNPKSQYRIGGSVNARLWLIMVIMGCMLGAGICFLEKVFRPKLIEEEDIEKTLGRKLLCCIPENKRYFIKGGSFFDESDDAAAYMDEVFRCAARVLKFQMKNEENRCICVASTTAREGRSSIAAHLAYHVSQQEQKTLLIDLDIDNPMLSSVFGVSADYFHSLNALYRGDCSDTDSITHLNRNLDLATVVLEPDQKLELTEDFCNMIRRIAANYQFVFIDTAPIDISSEIMTLRNITNHVLYIVKQDFATVKDIEKALHKMEQAGMEIYTCMVNAKKTRIRNAAVYSRSGKAAVRRQKRKTPGEAGETGLQDETTESRVMHSSGLDQKGLIDESIERSYEEFRAGEQQKKDDDNKES